jgi:hypothetical protein
VTAGLGLLRKVLPDLAAVECSGDREIPPPETLTDEEIDARLAVLRRDREAREFDEARGRNPDGVLARRLEMLTAKKP